LPPGYPRLDHDRVPRREAPGWARSRRLQPKRLGAHPGFHLLGQAKASGSGLHACAVVEEIRKGFRLEIFELTTRRHAFATR
jgi:hypothetical protein